MGITHFIALKWIIWAANPTPQLSRQAIENNIDFIIWGLKA
jgi:hypothetical protein